MGDYDKRLTFMSLKPRKKGEKRWTEKVFKEIMADNSPKFGKTNLQIQEAERNSNWINPKKSMSRHMIAKLKTEDKNNLENSLREMMHTYR